MVFTLLCFSQRWWWRVTCLLFAASVTVNVTVGTTWTLVQYHAFHVFVSFNIISYHMIHLLVGCSLKVTSKDASRCLLWTFNGVPLTSNPPHSSRTLFLQMKTLTDHLTGPPPFTPPPPHTNPRVSSPTTWSKSTIFSGSSPWSGKRASCPQVCSRTVYGMRGGPGAVWNLPAGRKAPWLSHQVALCLIKDQTPCFSIKTENKNCHNASC